MDSKYEFAYTSTKKWVRKTYPNLTEVEIEVKSKELVAKYIADNFVRDIEEQTQNEDNFNSALDKEFLNLFLDDFD
jgi:hypothetical protein